MDEDRKYLRAAIKIADDAIVEGGGPFGAVITSKGTILASSSNRVVINHDPTAHAEILAIREAASLLGTHDLGGCVLYASCEPCPMCLGAIYWSGIRRVVYASGRSDAAAAGFDDEHIYNEIALDPGRRKVAFIRKPDEKAREVFRKWTGYEGRIPY
ncbi:MAG: nucleoside deaminase [Bacteroidales bacterium]|nr:nucleoside deaminase [Bacteroidales bacterium]